MASGCLGVEGGIGLGGLMVLNAPEQAGCSKAPP